MNMHSHGRVASPPETAGPEAGEGTPRQRSRLGGRRRWTVLAVVAAAASAGLLTTLSGARAATVTFTTFTFPTTPAGGNAIALGPDHNLWSTEFFSGQIARIQPSGQITEFPVPNSVCMVAITAGPDGNMWFTDLCGNFIGRITMSGAVSEFPVPHDDVLPVWNKQGLKQAPAGITAGPDGALWFAEFGTDRIVQIRTDGTFGMDYKIPRHKGLPKGDPDASGPDGITVGPDGNLWFTESRFGGGPLIGNRVTRLALDGVFTEFPLPTADARPHFIATGPDHALWFTEEKANQIGRITVTGHVTEYAVPTANAIPDQICKGPDGNMWFTEAGNPAPGLGQILTASPHTVTEFTSPSQPDVSGGNGAVGIALGSDKNLWFTEIGPNTIVRAMVS